jgi:hypothetical protein
MLRLYFVLSETVLKSQRPIVLHSPWFRGIWFKLRGQQASFELQRTQNARAQSVATGGIPDFDVFED